MTRFLAKPLPDKRDGRRIRHSQRRLARSLLLLAEQGRRDHSGATELPDDPALRLATSNWVGTARMGDGGHYVAQGRNHAVLKHLALPTMDAAVWDALSNGVPTGEPRTCQDGRANGVCLTPGMRITRWGERWPRYRLFWTSTRSS